MISSFGLLLALGCSAEVPPPEPGPGGVIPGATGGTPSGTGGTGVVGGGNGGNSALAGASTAGPGGMSGVGGAPNAGGTGGDVGVAGSAPVAGAAGNGSGGGGPVGMYDVPHGKSTGCGKSPPGGDNPDGFTKHDIAVTGVDPAFVTAHPSNPGNNAPAVMPINARSRIATLRSLVGKSIAQRYLAFRCFSS